MTGPQRSGTRILTKMIAHDLGFNPVDEMAFGSWCWVAALKRCKRVRPFACQCPVLSFRAVEMVTLGNVAVVFCYRPVADIIRSQERIKWGDELGELRRYHEMFPGFFDNHPHLRSGPISVVKYLIWERIQEPKVVHPYRVWYPDFQGHPLWKSDRAGFQWNQTE